MSRYQLRRIGMPDNSSPSLSQIILDADILKFGRNPDQVQVILHSTFYSNMISREHAEIRRHRNPDGTTAYYLIDHSLNGTYVNEYRVKSSILLHPGDTIKFGHINGAAIPPGQHAPQPHAEFTYIFEKVPRNSSAVMSPQPQPVQQSPYAPQTPAGYMNPNAVPGYTGFPTGSSPGNQQQVFARAQAAAAYQPRLAAAYASYGATAFNAAYQSGFLSPHPAYAALYGYRTQGPNDATAGLCNPWQNQPTAARLSAGTLPTGSCAQMQPTIRAMTQGGGCTLPTSCSQVIEQNQQLITIDRALDTLIPNKQLPIMEQSSVIVGSGLLRSPIDDKSGVKKMECDSSVPSPPKQNVSSRLQMDDGLSQDLRVLAASAAENTRLLYNNSPDDLFCSDKTEVNTNDLKPESIDTDIEKRSVEPSGPVIWPHSPSPSVRQREEEEKAAAALLKSRRRKSNEVARLLNDLTEGSFMHQARLDQVKRVKINVTDTKPATDSLQKTSESHSSSSISPLSSGDGERRTSPGTTNLSDDASDERDKEKCSPLKKRKGFRSPIPPLSPPVSIEPAISLSPKPSSGRKKRSTTSLAAALRGPKKNMRRKNRLTMPKMPIRKGRMRRGRPKVAPVAEFVPIPGQEDVWSWHDSEQICASGVNCLKPTDDNVNWVACDDCIKWYHVDCVECDYSDAVREDFVFHCGCTPVKPRNKKRRSRRIAV